MSATQLKSDIVAVLANYDVEWRDDEVMAEPNAIRFSHRDRPISIVYDAECPSVSDLLQQKLREMGAAEKPVNHKPSGLVVGGNSTPVRTANNGRYTVFRSSQVIAVELEDDLVVDKGNVLLIPLNRPNTLIPIPKEQFAVLFSAIAKPAAAEEPSVVEPPAPAPPPPKPRATSEPSDDSDILTFLRSRNAPARSVTIATALGDSQKTIEDGLRRLHQAGMVTVEAGYWKPKPQRGRLSKIAVANGEMRIPPQMGRILAAMAYAAKTTGKHDLRVADVQQFLEERDRKQVSARLPGAVEKGLAERGLPLPDERGVYYQITAEGDRRVRELGSSPFTSDGMAPPDWLEQLM